MSQPTRPIQEPGGSQTNCESPQRRIVAIGASAGGIEALTALVGGLPADFSAAVLVVVHVSPNTVSLLPKVLNRAGPLPARHAEDGEPITGGQIYVAPPDLHMIVRDGHIELNRGPRENHSRPAIDPLFRSISHACGPSAIGVVLSGALYDGASGLLALTARGGLAIVQDPNDATVETMPQSALRLIETDYVVPAAAIGPLLGRLVDKAVEEKEPAMIDGDARIRDAIHTDIEELGKDLRAEKLTIYTCPDCGGPMWQTQEGMASRFVCHVGHAYGADLLFGQKADELEGALWACVRLFKEKATLARQVASRRQALGDNGTSERTLEQADMDARRAELIREMLTATPQAAD